MDINLFFQKLTASFHLDKLISDAVRVYGGLTHTTYKLMTANKNYAVKLLNPKIMKRPDAMENFLEADRLEIIIQKSSLQIVPSLTFDGKKMQMIDGQYFYIYEWFDGNSLKNKDITKLHCQKISSALSHLHHIDMRNEKFKRNPINIDWESYINLAKEQNEIVFNLLNANKKLLYESQYNGNLAIKKVPDVMSICHNDMDSKNVLWKNNDFNIIDLECLGYANPYLELFELALCWSGYENCNIDFELFKTFINAYFEQTPKINIDCEALYYSNYGRLEWLEYNVKRALAIECSTIEEQELGIEQVFKTMEHVIYYNDIKGEILNCLTEIFF